MCLIKGSVYHCRPGRPKPVTWWLKGNTVFGTIWSISCWAQDYLLDNHIKEDWEKGGGRQREKKKHEVKRPKRLKEEERKGVRLRTHETKLEKKTGRGETRRGPDNQASQCWATTDHKEEEEDHKEYLAQNATMFYVNEKKNVNRIYVSQFPTNWHLSLFHTLTQTHSVIPHVGTDTHSLRGGIGLVNLPIISSHRCN